ncbi:hypothetical protein DDE05_17950 [Streptomyces cavourensis]|nr:hypothetical protein DDE05_17950 [Streptomyces cavourensis]
MMHIQLVYPDGYDEIAEFEHEKKGYLLGVQLHLKGSVISLDFYDIARLTQDTAEALSEKSYVHLENVVIVDAVTKLNIELAARRIAGNNEPDYVFL